MDFEQLGSFYLGRRYDLGRRAATADLVLYDSRDLVTHAVCVGMTGSGKTGLCLALIEEAALDHIPALVIDPKGDLGNLLTAWLHRTQRLELLVHGKAVSRPGESERDFRLRLQQAAREQRDTAVERLRQAYAPRIAALQEKIRRAEQAVAREAEQATQSGIQTAISVGATILGAFLGRKSVTASTLGRATTAARGASRVLKERQDVGRAQETVEALRQQLADLEAAFEAEVARLADAAAPLTAALSSLSLAPTRQNISVRLLALAWTPSWRGAPGGPLPG